MTDLLTGLGANHLVGFILVLARISPLFIFAPLFSSKLLPMRIRGIVAVALAVGLAPLAIGGRQMPGDVLAIAELVVKEMLVGLAFAFVVGMIVFALQAAGGFIDTLIGFAFGAAVDPVTGNNSAILAQLYGLIGVMIFVAIQGDALVIRGLAETYELVPILEMPHLGALLDGTFEAFTAVFASALKVAAPVLVALVLTDAAFGLVTRVVPQLNVFSVGLPAKVLVGLLVVGATVPFIAGWIDDELERSVSAALGALGVTR